MSDLGTLPGGTSSAADAINSLGQIVGYSDIGGGVDSAFLYSGGNMIDLNTLLPANSGWVLQQGLGINDSGQVVGNGDYTDPNLGGPALSQAFRLDTHPPTISSLSPTSATAGGPAFTLTVTGTYFVGGAVVMWNTTALTTTFVGATSLTAAVPASLIAAAGSPSITVTTTGGTSSPATFTINPPPTLSNLNPNSAHAGSGGFPLTINGANFFPGAVANWGATALATSYGNGGQLTATVPSGLIATAGTASVTVTLGGVTTAGLPFTIIPPPPTIASLNPSSGIAGGPLFTLTINGTNFVPGAVATWKSTALATTYVSPTQITAAVPATLIAAPGTASVTVTTTGGVSSPATFTIKSQPTITSLSPTSVTVGAAAFTLTVNGTNFVSGATVVWNYTPLTTTFASATRLTAAVPASLLTTAGTISITVSTTAGSSAAAKFTINPHPTITSLSPSSTTAGGAAFTLTINGTGFVSGATVTFGNAALTTTFVSATKLTAAVPALYFGRAGAVSVVVYNPGRISSNAASFTVH